MPNADVSWTRLMPYCEDENHEIEKSPSHQLSVD